MKAAPDSLTAKLRDYYQRNPGEMLSLQDIAVKFDAKSDNIRSAVQNLRRQGVVRLEYVVMAGSDK